jgi:hypothetical protein
MLRKLTSARCGLQISTLTEWKAKCFKWRSVINGVSSKNHSAHVARDPKQSDFEAHTHLYYCSVPRWWVMSYDSYNDPKRERVTACYPTMRKSNKAGIHAHVEGCDECTWQHELTRRSRPRVLCFAATIFMYLWFLCYDPLSLGIRAVSVDRKSKCLLLESSKRRRKKDKAQSRYWAVSLVLCAFDRVVSRELLMFIVAFHFRRLK